MDPDKSQPVHHTPSRPAQYLTGYDRGLTDQYAARTADRQATFLLRHLRPGMSLLDCGSGPGSIATGLAQVLAPGEVVGIDIEPGQVEQARASAAKHGVTNVRFQVADVFKLPFPDGSFDGILANSLLGYFSDPLPALREMRRVLRAGGVVGVRIPDSAADLFAPTGGPVERSYRLWIGAFIHTGFTLRGSVLRGTLGEAGFTRCEMSASSEYWGDAAAIRAVAEKEARRVETAPVFRQVVRLGWATDDELARLAAEIRAWGEHPDAFLCRTYCEAVGWKEG